jgi:hypothetical protein
MNWLGSFSFAEVSGVDVVVSHKRRLWPQAASLIEKSHIEN